MEFYWRTDSFDGDSNGGATVISLRALRVLRALAVWPTLALVPALTLLLALGATTTADAKEQQEYYRGSHFTPQVTVTPSTTQAGAHPDLNIHVRKSPNHCPGQTYAPFEIVTCDENDVYLEQDLKEMTVHLPQGLLADVNAASQCDLRGWAKVGLFGKQTGNEEGNFVACPADSQVGVVEIGYPNFCRWKYTPPPPGQGPYGCGSFEKDSKLGLGIGFGAAGMVFNGVPEPGEQAHLYALVGFCLLTTKYPEPCDPRSGMSEWGLNYLVQLVDIGVRLRTDSDWGIDATATGIPDAMCPDGPCPPNGYFTYPVDDLTFSLFGQAGAEREDPFVVNPTSCQPRDASADFRAFSQNVWDSAPEFSMGWWTPGSGDGMTVASASPYPVEGCDSLPYAPQASLSVDPAAPGAPAAITSTVTQQVGEQATKRVEVRFPKSFKVNFQNRLAQCSADHAAARACPATSQVGTVEVQSNLLPKTGDSAGPLRGEVFLGETTATDIKLYIVLHGWIEATLQGSIAMNADGSSQAGFDLPEVPVQTVALTLFGGADKALVTTPKTCGTKTIEAAFTSHQGAERTLNVPVEVSCTAPTFDAGLSTRRTRAHPTLDLTTGSSGLSSVRFDLPAGLKVAHRPGRLKTLGSYGALTLEGEGGSSELKLKLLGVGRKGQLSFAAVEAGAAHTSLAGKRVSLGGRKRTHGKRSTRPRRLNLGDLPSGTTGVSLQLAGKRDGLLQNPSACHTRGRDQELLKLAFTAHIVTTDGKAHTLHQTVAMTCLGSSHGRGR